MSGDVINAGTLTKTGSGRLILGGTSTHASTTVTQGALIVNGSHAPDIHVQGGTLGGNGTVGTVDVTTGAIDPGNNGTAILTAAQLSLAAGGSFAVQINGPAAGTDYDRLDVTGTATLTQPTLSVQLGYAPPSGTTFTILTHASGTFAGLPEGARVAVGAARLRITYHAGSGDDGTSVVHNVTLPATSRLTVRVNDIDGLASAAFSTSVASTQPVIAERGADLHPDRQPGHHRRRHRRDLLAQRWHDGGEVVHRARDQPFQHRRHRPGQSGAGTE